MCQFYGIQTCSNQIAAYMQTLWRRGRGRGGREGVSLSPKFSVDVPLFSDEFFKCALFERSSQKCP